MHTQEKKIWYIAEEYALWGKSYPMLFFHAKNVTFIFYNSGPNYFSE